MVQSAQGSLLSLLVQLSTLCLRHCLGGVLQGELVDEIHRTGVVDSTEFTETGTEVRGRVPPALAQRLRPLRLQMAAAAAAGGNGSGGGGDGSSSADSAAAAVAATQAEA